MGWREAIVDRSEGREDLAQQALPQPVFSTSEPRERGQIHNDEEQTRGPGKSLSRNLSLGSP